MGYALIVIIWEIFMIMTQIIHQIKEILYLGWSSAVIPLTGNMRLNLN